jgi:hypothetical protein
MCGIADVFGYGAYGEGSAEQIIREVVTIRDTMAPRGSDGHGEWLSGNGRVAFGHRRLAIVGVPSVDARRQRVRTRSGSAAQNWFFHTGPRVGSENNLPRRPADFEGGLAIRLPESMALNWG